MIFSFLSKNLNFFTFHERKIKFIILIFTLYFSKIKRSEDSVLSKESLYCRINCIDSILMDYKDIEEVREGEGDCLKYVLNDLSDNQSIYIYIKCKNANKYLKIFKSLQFLGEKFNILFKENEKFKEKNIFEKIEYFKEKVEDVCVSRENILGIKKDIDESNSKVVFMVEKVMKCMDDLKDDFTFCNYLKMVSSVRNMKCKVKNIKIILCSEILKKKGDSFLDINLCFGAETFVKIYPFLNFQCNSDILNMGKYFFESKVFYKFENKFNLSNKIDICLSEEMKSGKIFLCFLRALNNMHSHSLGSYFYIPFENYCVEMVSLFPFMVLNMVYCLVVYFFGKKKEFKFSYFHVLYIAYPFFPLICVFFLFSEIYLQGIMCVLFGVLNFSVGIIYNYVVFYKNLYEFFY
ncbi:hypothetical protein CWI38_1114p0020 [Hamiltosporidium tvaerminnensis]|uniref:Uncharacterized protein n=1 Tax=Hamiltosporidium tvaerminnensis TaxID=1176355 RepID=A0A4Q9LTW4_9MICR|nr:hypothetical protein CWI38_1114p0020 [Hamiltosporidium tvaerminnensis]